MLYFSLTWIYLILPCTWISLSLCATLECALAYKPSSLNSLSNRSLPGVAAEAPNILHSWRSPSRTLRPCLSSLRLPLPESSITDILELCAEMDVKNALIKWYIHRFHCLGQCKRCAGMIQTTRLVHRPHRPNHRTEANKLHRQREMYHLIWTLFISDSCMTCRKVCKFGILQFAPDDTLDCKVPGSWRAKVDSNGPFQFGRPWHTRWSHSCLPSSWTTLEVQDSSPSIYVNVARLLSGI